MYNPSSIDLTLFKMGLFGAADGWEEQKAPLLPKIRRGMFLDISKAFDRVWHDGLLFKLKKNNVSGNLFQLIKSFLSGRFQRVLLNGQTSDWETRQAGVPQGSRTIIFPYI